MINGQAVQYVQVPLAGLPVHLICLSTGLVMFTPVAKISVVWCPSQQGVSAYLLADHFQLYAKDVEPVDFEYQRMYDYRQVPLLRQWLQELNLQNPLTGEFRDANHG